MSGSFHRYDRFPGQTRFDPWLYAAQCACGFGVYMGLREGDLDIRPAPWYFERWGWLISEGLIQCPQCFAKEAAGGG
jgi:hypothetical protein